jgi:hypothetical protein
VIYSPECYSIGWERGDPEARENETAFRLGANVAAYVVAAEDLVDKLDSVKVAFRQKMSEGRVMRGALVMAQIRYGGDWDPYSQALARLMSYLRDEAGLNVSTEKKAVTLADEDLFKYPVMYLTGYQSFELPETQVKSLKAHLDRGGFLWIDVACGKEPNDFDQSARELVAQLYGPGALEELPLDHPVFSIGYKIDKVHYSPRARQVMKVEEWDRPHVEAVTCEKRIPIVYTRYNLGASLEGQKPTDSIAVQGETAYQLAANIILFAMAY